ncbi:MAG: hypothetical protein D6769_02960 [Methanobacteriota archaeon]|nr:MAG: hypothetical protein D6769_02960 [Euryarchaeota archaeon]
MKRLFFAFLLISMAFSANLFINASVGESNTSVWIFPYIFNSTSPVNAFSMAEIRNFDFKINAISPDKKDSVNVDCHNKQLLSSTLKVDVGEVILNGVECSFPTPDILKNGCGYVQVSSSANIGGELVKAGPSQVIACYEKLSYPDRAVIISNQGHYVDFTNPICFTALLVAALFIAAFYAKGGGSITSLYDLVYPRMLKMPQVAYTLRGPSPIGALAKGLAKGKAEALNAAALRLGLGVGASEDTVLDGIRKAVGKPGATIEDLANFFADEKNREMYDDAYGAFRLYMTYKNMGTGSLGIIGNKRVKKVEWDWYKKYAGKVKTGWEKLPSHVRTPITWSFLPLKHLYRGVKMGFWGIRGAARLVGQMSGVVPAGAGFYRGMKRAEIEKGKRIPLEEGSKVSKWIGSKLKASHMAMSKEHLLWNPIKHINAEAKIAEEALMEQLFMNGLYWLATEEGRAHYAKYLEEMGNIDIVNKKREENEKHASNARKELEEFFKSIEKRDIERIWEMTRELNEANLDAYLSLVGGYSSEYAELIGKLRDIYREGEENIRNLYLLDFVADEYADGIRELGLHSRFSKDEDIITREGLGNLATESMYNYMEYVYGAPDYEKAAANGIDTAIAEAINAMYGISSEGNNVERYYSAMDERNSFKNEIKNAKEHDEWARSLLSRVFEREGFTVSDRELYKFLSAKQELKEHIRNLAASEDEKRVMKKFADYIAVSAKTKVREPWKKSAIGKRWNFVTNDMAKKAEKLSSSSVGKAISLLFDESFNTRVGMASAFVKGERGYVEGAIGTGKVRDIKAVEGEISKIVGDAISRMGVSASASYLDNLKNTIMVEIVKQGGENASAIKSIIEKNLREVARDYARTGKKVDKKMLKALEQEIHNMAKDIEAAAGNISKSGTIEVRYRTALDGEYSIRIRSLMTIEASDRNWKGYDSIRTTRDLAMHFMIYGAKKLGEEKSLKEVMDYLSDEKNLTIDDWEMNQSIKSGKLAWLEVANSMFMPMFTNGSNNESVETINKLFKDKSSIASKFEERVKLGGVLNTISNIPDLKVIGLGQIYAVASVNGILNVEKNLEIYPSSVEDLKRISALLEKRGDSAGAAEVLLLVDKINDESLSHNDRAIVKKVMEKTKSLIEEGELDLFEAARIGYSYGHSTGDYSLVFNKDISGVVVGTTREVADEIKRVGESGTGVANKVSVLFENMKMKGEMLRQGIGESLEAFSFALMPMRDVEIFMPYNEVTKHHALSVVEYFEKELRNLDNEKAGANSLLSKLKAEAKALRVKKKNDPTNTLLAKQLEDKEKEIERAEKEIKRLEKKKERIEASKKSIDSYIDSMSFYATRDNFYIYNGWFGSKEARLAKQQHMRGTYAGGALLTRDIMHSQGGITLRPSEIPMGFLTSGGIMFKLMKLGAFIGEPFRKFQKLASEALLQPYISPSGYDVKYEADREMMKNSRNAGIDSAFMEGVQRAKDVYEHPLKQRVDMARARSLRGFVETITGTFLPIGAIAAAIASGPTATITAGVALGAYPLVNKLFKKMTGSPYSLYEWFLDRFSKETFKTAMDLEDLTWRATVGLVDYSWYSREMGEVMGGGAKAIPGLSYHQYTSGEYALNEPTAIAYNRMAKNMGPGYNPFEVPENKYGFGAVRYNKSILRRVEEQNKEMEGTGPAYNFAFGLFSPALFINYLTPKITRKAAMYRAMPGKALAKDLTAVATTAAAIYTVGPLGPLAMGSAYVAAEMGIHGDKVLCPRCRKEKKRGQHCPVCGFKPASPSI